MEKGAKKHMGFIDTHVHAMDFTQDGLDKVAAWMDENNVDRCIIHPLAKSRFKSDAQRETMLANYRKYKGKIDRFYVIFPKEVKTVDEAVKIFEREKRDGAIGFGEVYNNRFKFDSPENMRLFKACETVGFPVMCHVEYGEVGAIENVLKAHPNLVLIAHAHWWGHLGSGVCDKLLRTYPNLYGDISAGSGSRAFKKNPEYSREFIIRHADKLIFGTDAGWWEFKKKGQSSIPQFTQFEELNLPEDVLDKLYRKNAGKLFGF